MRRVFVSSVKGKAQTFSLICREKEGVPNWHLKKNLLVYNIAKARTTLAL